MNVANNAPALVTNTAQVLGGGDDTPVTANDPTTINAAAPVGAVGAPTMNEWGMILLAVLLGIGSIYYLKRRA